MRLETTPEKHEAAINALKERRKNEPWKEDNRKLDNTIRDYRTHLNKCGIGTSIIDVGCGRQYLKECLPPYIKYIGVDAFPADGYEDVTYKMKAEEQIFTMFVADTVVAFAVLDNCQNFHQAIKNMKLVANRNIIILTGIGIEPDEYHTMRLELSDFDDAFSDWPCTYKEEVSPKVWLLNFKKP